ncbi:Inactive tyrosine-protein kinase 7 [Nymphon striatum]|nr:Inactive tyrosine-protein kinase 7 [Nymphon striatum]
MTDWYFRNTGPLSNTSRLTVYPNGTLIINRVRGSDKGLYNCRGMLKEPRNKHPQNYAVRLTLAYLEDFSDQPFKPKKHDQLNVVPENSAFEVACEYPDGLPKPKVWWENPAGRVISSSGHVRVEDGRLVIDGAKKADSGKYSCVVENMIGQKHKSLQLEISVPPKITSDPRSIPVIDEGETASVKCNYEASPFPLTEVLWLKDGNYLQEIGGHFRINKENGTLDIHELAVSDKGSYICEVKTQGFKPVRSKEVVILIKEKLKFVPVPVDKNLELGSNSKIYCKARGSSKPVVKWVKKEKGEIIFNWPEHITDNEGTLYFKGVQMTDAGKYMCIATNSQGLINATIKVGVVVFPRFLIKPKNISGYEGESVMIHCTAFSDPYPTIKWDNNSDIYGFDQERSTVFENGTLLIKNLNLNDQGRYGCTAGNMGGFKREEIILSIRVCQKEGVMTKTVVITMSVAASYMLLVIGLMVWCRCRRARRKATWVAETENENNEGDALTMESNHKIKNGIVHNCKGDKHWNEGENPSQQSNGSHSSRRSRSSYDRINFPRHDIDMNNIMKLGNGEFGSVVITRAIGIIDGERESTVMIKSLENRDEEMHFEFKKEMDMFHKLNHDNVVKLLGICREAEPALMILEYVDVGDLKQFLLAMRKGTQRKGHRSSSLSHLQIMNICNQVATGMEHLSNHRFIHKDLAARNCLINSSFEIKITIQKLSLDTYKSDYVTYRNQLLPVRWIAPEAFLEDEYSTKSDVWSFAVLVWEVLHQAQIPFFEHSDEEIMNLLEQKLLKWSLTDSMASGLSTLLIQCWSDSPKYRPTFSEIVIQIGDMLANGEI